MKRLKKLLVRLRNENDGAVLPFYAVLLCIVVIPLMLYILNIMSHFVAISEVQLAADSAALADSDQQNIVHEHWIDAVPYHIRRVQDGVNANGQPQYATSCVPGSVYNGWEYHNDITESEAFDKAQEYLDKNHLLFIHGLTVSSVNVKDNYVYPDGNIYMSPNPGLDYTYNNQKIPSSTSSSVHHPTVTVTVHASYTPILPLLTGTSTITKTSQSQLSYTGHKEYTKTVAWNCGQPEPSTSDAQTK